MHENYINDFSKKKFGLGQMGHCGLKLSSPRDFFILHNERGQEAYEILYQWFLQKRSP